MLTPEERKLNSFNYEPPPPLAEFAGATDAVDYDEENNEIFLYHGTNCYRRWEINKSGAIEPGRNSYSFFSSKPQDAYKYARAAAMRDIKPGAFNSLILEPVVLKVRFNSRTWVQVDFIQGEGNPEDEDSNGLSLAVLGPVPCNSIVDVLHCMHGRRLGAGSETIRSFEDGRVMEGIRHLKETLMKDRLDSWLMKKMGIWSRRVGTSLKGGEVPDVTLEDEVRRLRQLQVRA